MPSGTHRIQLSLELYTFGNYHTMNELISYQQFYCINNEQHFGRIFSSNKTVRRGLHQANMKVHLVVVHLCVAYISCDTKLISSDSDQSAVRVNPCET